MRANRSFDTGVERKLRSALHRLGLRFTKHANVDPGVKCRADVIFRRARLCVFVDGCFWHGCPKHFRSPNSNRSWWTEKIADNRTRDRRKTAALRKLGWTVMRVWEHELVNGTDRVAEKIKQAVKGAQRRFSAAKTAEQAEASSTLRELICNDPRRGSGAIHSRQGASSCLETCPPQPAGRRRKRCAK